jgi:hypothetical protein
VWQSRVHTHIEVFSVADELAASPLISSGVIFGFCLS